MGYGRRYLKKERIMGEWYRGRHMGATGEVYGGKCMGEGVWGNGIEEGNG